MNRYDKIIIRGLLWPICAIIILTFLFLGIRHALAAECVPPRIEGPPPLSKVGGEYGPLKTLGDHQVILTFDDGPHPHNTPIILGILKQSCISAVFFPIGINAQHNPELVRAMVNDGHTVGSHSWSHPQPFQHYSNNVTSAEIMNGVNIIREITGRSPRYFRYPGLGHNSYTESFTTQTGLTVWSIDVDAKDYTEPGTGTLVNRILSQLHERHKGIIVLHENHATSVAALPVIIQALRSNGYEIVGIK